MLIRVLAVVAAVVTALATAPAAAQSNSELLEKGIYTEETVGDVDGAIQIYRAITDADSATRPLVAEALFRLGMCHLKNDDAAAATTAFERLIADFPDQEQLVARAHDNMPADPQAFELLPPPWTEGEAQQYTVTLASGVVVGTVIATIDLADVEGEQLWRMRLRRRFLSDQDNQAISQVLARQDSLAPVTGLMRHTLLGHFEADYGGEKVSITTVGPDKKREQEISGRFFDSEQTLWLIRRMPLEVGFAATVRLFTPVEGDAKPVKVEVPDKEMIEVAAGVFECFRVELDVGQTLWFSTDPSRLLVRFEGSGITGELDRVYEQFPDEPHGYTDDEKGYSITLPPDWLTYEYWHDGAEALLLLDPFAWSRGRLEVYHDPGEERCIPRQVAEHVMAALRVRYPDHTIPEEEWSEEDISGRPALSFVSPYKDGGRDITLYWTCIRSGDLCVQFTFKVETEHFEELREHLDAIFESYDGPRKSEAVRAAESLEADPSSEAAISVKSVLTDFHQAGAQADLDGYLEHLAPDLVFLGTDATERFDRDRLRQLVEPLFSKGEGWESVPLEQHVFLSEDRTMAWFDEKLESSSYGEMRSSGVLRKERDRWRIVQYTVGFPIPNELVPDLVTEIQELEVEKVPPGEPSTPDIDDLGHGAASAVRAVLDDFHLSAVDADGDRYFGHFAADGVFLGTDRAERFTVASMKAFIEPYFKRGIGWTSTPVEQHVFLSPDGSIAWFEELLEREQVGTMRTTGVMRRVDGTWKISHANAVIPVPNELTESLVRKIRDHYETPRP